MEKRVPASQRTRGAFRDSIEGGLVSADACSEPICLAIQLIAEEALEAEQRELFGRDYFEHGRGAGPGPSQRRPPGQAQDGRGHRRVRSSTGCRA